MLKLNFAGLRRTIVSGRDASDREEGKIPLKEMLERLGISSLFDERREFCGTVVDGRYRLTGMIGEGGLGKVYSAIDTVTGREVAVKVAAGIMDESRAETALYTRREGMALRLLRHANIVGYVGSGDFGGGAYVAMERVNGVLLRERLADNATLPYRACRSIFMQLCDALGEAHRKGVVHADVKPGNVFLTAGGPDCGASDSPGVKLFDFGLAKFLRAGGDAERSPGPGIVLGTIDYLAPEQCNLEDFDHRADIYALGLTLYRAMSGFLPYQCGTNWEVVTAKLHDEPIPVRLFCPDAPGGLGETVMKAIERDPSKRFQSASEMKAALAAAC